MQGLLWAVKFLTVIPIDRRNRFTPMNMGAAMVWFPAVGLLIGVFLIAAYLLLIKWFPSSVSDALILILYVGITGGLHLDGLADSCDGIFGGHSKEKRLEIMRQSTIGTFGALGLICVLGIRYIGTHNIIYDGQLGSFWMSQKGMALLLMPAVGRWAQMLGAALSAYARKEDGVGKVFIENVQPKHAIYSALFLLILLWFFYKINGLIIFAVVTFVALLVIQYIKGKIGGMTGDTLGAVNEISEVVFLLLCVLCVK